ncbi:MAG: aminotransferase class I/II-fold pyridoxal phosphate-dependent enzyme [Gemmatimonadetes bacterium]|nr:aminotransferase class I/II-fold pyridoxal phosphate-dependent enzyme [Candidatus Palauibacter rhopaloidicola]
MRQDTVPDTTSELGVGERLEMSPEAMLELAREAAEILVRRRGELAGEGAWDGEFRDALEERLMEDPPEEGQPAADVMGRAVRDVLKLALRLDHPGCFGFVPSSPTWPGVVADFLASGYNLNACNWLVGSGPSQLECVVIEWFRRWLGMPETAGGLLTSGGSAASLDALVAAREAAGYPERATVYMSDQSHPAHVRAVKIAGIRPDHARIVPSDGRSRIDLDALARMVAEDRAAGRNPIAVCANAGATATGAIDPLPELADFCAAEDIWFHVDAAYGGFAIVTERGRKLLRGIERADSVGLDAHKWFFQPYEVGCLLVRDVSTLEEPFGVQPTFLQDSLWGSGHPNLTDRGLQMSRSARALKIWMSVQTFGMAAFRDSIANGLDLAARAEAYIDASPALECLSPATLSIVCFRFRPSTGETGAEIAEETLDELNREVLARLFWEDPAFVSSAVVSGKFALRVCIVNYNTTWDDVRAVLEATERFGTEALKQR